MQKTSSVDFFAAVLAEVTRVSTETLFAVGASVVTVIGDQCGKHDKSTEDGADRSEQISAQHDEEADDDQRVSELLRFANVHGNTSS